MSPGGFRLLPEGTALAFYAAFVPFLVVFALGLRRGLRRIGWNGSAAADPGRPAIGRGRGLRRLLSDALLQRKVLERPFSGGAHAAIFWGFLVLLLGDLMLFAEVYVLAPLGRPLLAGAGNTIFQAALDLSGLAFLAGVLAALARRLGPSSRAAVPARGVVPLLLALLFIGASGFALEGLRLGLEPADPDPGAFVGGALAPLFEAAGASGRAGLLAYGVLWWSHALAAFGLLAAIPYTRLFHSLLAPLHLLLSDGGTPGTLRTPFELAELVRTGNFDVRVGARSIADFHRRDRLALRACTDCGRCEEVCPAHATGTTLSPRELVQALAREVDRPAAASGFSEAAVTGEAVWACTLCGACARACPVAIDPATFVVELRRERAAAGRLTGKVAEMLANLARTGNPYGAPLADRERVAAELGLRTLAEDPRPDLVYWIGCAATYDPRSRGVARAVVRILEQAGVRAGVLGAEENCTGDVARRAGEEGRFQELALRNIATFEKYGVRRVLTHCAHCYNTLRNEYPRFGARVEVIHHAALIDALLREGKLVPTRPLAQRVALHDACYLGRINGVTREPRRALDAVPGLARAELPQRAGRSFCCGAGGANYWFDVPRRESMAARRSREALASGAGVLAVECPYCLRMLEDATAAAGAGDAMQVRDLAELVADSLGPRETGTR